MPRGRACRRARTLLFASMRLDPAGLPFIGGALLLALVSRCRARLGACRPVRRARRVLRLLLSRSGTLAAADSHGGHAVLSPADGRVLVAGAAERRRGAARRVAADQHLSVADGRARQPDPGVRPRDARQLHAGPVPARLPPRRRRAATSAARSGSITAARWSSRGRSSACSRAASSAALQVGRRGARRRPLRHHEVRLADGHVPAAHRHASGATSARWCAAGETVIAVLH